MQSISKLNKGIRFLLCVINIYSKYAWVGPLKDKKRCKYYKCISKILNDSKSCKPNKTWVYKGSEFYNSYFKKWLKDNDIEMYSTNNEGKSVVTKRFTRTLKNKIHKHMTAISGDKYIDKLDDI